MSHLEEQGLAGPVRLVVRPLLVEGSPTSVLRGLRGSRGLVALIGDWCGGGAILAWDPAEVLPADADPFDLPGTVRFDGARVGFGGGWIGLWGYQLNRRLEAVPPPPPRPVAQPDHWLARYDWVLRYDAEEAAWSFESVLEPDRAQALQGRVEALLAAASRVPCRYVFDPFVMDAGAATYRAAIAAAREHIWAGDIFQANICTRFTSRLDGDPLDAFCDGVDALAPSYAAYLDTGERQVVSLSPELFLGRDGREVVTRPIKGTAPAAQDPALLARSAKDRAENVMIVDLMRNDLGRVCEPGSVRVPSLARPERGAGVRHLASEVRGTLPGAATDGDLLRATFPPGSVTGAPKVRAMELIHELESTGRELYTGAIGYVSPVAGLEASVVIRTFEFHADTCWVGIGCGIVADSDPDREVAEAYTKVEPLLAAVGATLATAPPPAVPDVPLARTPPLPLAGSRDAFPEVGHGVFETLVVRQGSAIDLAAHLDRLLQSVAALYVDHPDRSRLEARVRREAAMQAGTARLRVTYSPEGRHFGVESHAIEDPRLERRTLAVATVPDGLGDHKWADRRLVERLQAEAGHADDVLLVDAGGFLLECGSANVFVVLDGEVVTPPLDGRILSGVVRADTLELLRAYEIPASERPVDLGELAGVREVFTTSSVRGIQPVVTVPGVGSWSIGSTTRWVQQAIERRGLRPATGDGPRTASVRRTSAKVLIIDNYDSFTYNLAQCLRGLGAAVDVVRNDRMDAPQLAAGAAGGSFTHLVISPGPGGPDQAGISVAAVRAVGSHTPVLGVCLGHQCIGVAYGARVVRAPWPVHGKASLVHHDGHGIYGRIEGPLLAGRYHSLVLTDLPSTLVPTAHSGDGTLMGVRHRTHPVEGIQVHPESILTPRGSALLAAFLEAGSAPSDGVSDEIPENSSNFAS